MRRAKRGTLAPNPNSIVIDLLTVMRVRGIKYPSAFLLQLGINSKSATKLLRGEAAQINLKQLTQICVALNCTPNDLFVLRDLQLEDQHELWALRKFKPISELKTVEEYFLGKSVGEVRDMLGR